MPEFKLGNIVRVTKMESRNAGKIGRIINVDERGITVKAIDTFNFFFNTKLDLCEVVFFAPEQVHWLTIHKEMENVVAFPMLYDKSKVQSKTEKEASRLDEIDKRNAQNQERMKAERAKKNKDLIRSLRLKK